MPSIQKRWLLKKTNKDFLDYFARELDISPLAAQVLVNRDIKTPDAARDFLHSTIDSIGNPFSLTGMERAVAEITGAIASSKKIFISGDYDADGTTAAAILAETLQRMGGSVECFIPSRFKHGYGFHTHAVERAKELGCGLIVTVDCGISSFEAVETARRCGLGVIITDHHEPYVEDGGTQLPRAISIINPKIEGGSSSFPNLTGAGIALMLSSALSGNMDKGLLDIAALGTIADVAPLTGENRLIVRDGLRVLRETRRPGLKALIKCSGINGRTFEPDMLSYMLIPKINAAGRMDDASSVVRLLLTDDPAEAQALAEYLTKLNQERQKIEEEVFKKALIKIESAKPQGRVIVVADEDWHEGVIGIVASKLVDRFNLPSIVFSIKDGVARGSARSIQDVDICKAIASCSQHIIQFGGHKQAAGVKLKAADIPAFEQAINSFAHGEFSNVDLEPPLTIDVGCYIKDMNMKLMSDLARLAPYGYGNPDPIFGSRGLLAIKPRIVGRNHLKMKLGHNGFVIDAIGYDMGGLINDIDNSESIDAAFTPIINEWNGNRSVQLNIKALRASE
ncbi:single-stranded-DNA-specific exonuclease RecJ [Candidatus Magnetominusculus xianensis]|uniref:Single-stranded-DNA-specific exonuclease RecJ n=1 Tax=Candidatus Magnetominusculus xianensis TaxID=1748249 RepID=A0ABR5SBI0_9BACT|nr:single-stranded-DNA-specific exonuclease RecJ [Candidatus Magnetominusculus xianensis]KWT77392.1 single-stranded-DNA-specific exonuclease RecJ [Candidatus Magnetominusculus xianensis]MBF0405176.1 single-stranded-DNA-specific exonuclease RecJ [Nitrospirota bacterium]